MTLTAYYNAYGPRAAQWIAQKLGFPVPPPELIERGRQYEMPFIVEGRKVDKPLQ